MITKFRILAALALVGLLAACSDGGSPSAAGRQVAFSIATHSPVSAASSLSAAGDVITDSTSNDTLVIDSVQVVLRKISLKRVEASVPCDSLEDGGEHNEHADDCEKVQAGPLFLDLPLGAGAQRQFTVDVDTGTYNRLRIQLHKPTDSPGDAQILTDHPEIAGASVRVVGSFNGTPFVYTTDISANQETELVPPLVVGTAAPTDLTLFVDISKWFVDGGGAVVDPATALNGQPNEHLVRDNIRDSFSSFEDHNHNGEDDHDGHDDGGDHHGGNDSTGHGDNDSTGHGGGHDHGSDG